MKTNTDSTSGPIPGQRGKAFLWSSLEKRLRACNRKTLGELDWKKLFSKPASERNKGIAGHVIELCVLNQPKPDPKQQPDIVIDGVRYEVKSTGVWEFGSEGEGLHAKEPVSITAVSPGTMKNETFENSAFFHKIEHMLFFFYHYNKPKTETRREFADFPLLLSFRHGISDFSSIDIQRIKADWMLVHNRINEADKKGLPYSDKCADINQSLQVLNISPSWKKRPRFRFTKPFVDSIFQRWIGFNPPEDKKPIFILLKDLETKCHILESKYGGKTLSELVDYFNIEVSPNTRAIGATVMAHMFNCTTGRLNAQDCFVKSGIRCRTIVLKKKGKKEDLPLFQIDFDELESEDLTFEESQFYAEFSSQKLLFAVFEEYDREHALQFDTLKHSTPSLAPIRFRGFSFLSFDERFITRCVYPVWKKLHNQILSNEVRRIPYLDTIGEPVINRSGTEKEGVNFPKAKEGDVFVRGRGKNASNKTFSLCGIKMYPPAVWIRGSFLFAEILKSLAPQNVVDHWREKW